MKAMQIWLALYLRNSQKKQTKKKGQRQEGKK
jgi:hypothetical protein